MRQAPDLLSLDTYNVGKSYYDRFDILVSHKLLPFCQEAKGKTTHELTRDYAFGSGIVDELNQYGITTEQLPNLRAYADVFGGEIIKSHGKITAKLSNAKLQGIFDSDVEIELRIKREWQILTKYLKACGDRW